MWNIAKEYEININDLIKINNLNNLTLSIGQQLIVPKKDIIDSENEYIVQKGDTLWSISKKYNIAVDDLKKINNIANNLLTVGQKLIIK